ASRGRRWPRARTLAAVAGSSAVAAAGVVSDATFLGHMVGHLLLGMVGPLLLALGAPVTLVLQAGSDRARRFTQRALRWRPLAALSHPVVGFVVFGASLVALYVTPLLEISERNTAVHVLVHLHLVAAGCVFLWPLVGVDPTPRRTPFGARLLAVL